MQFYTKTHQHYCGIDLHARTMYVCVMNPAGEILVHRNIKTDQEKLGSDTNCF
jgi:predicted NBD/HSP70 family sugar kinase